MKLEVMWQWDYGRSWKSGKWGGVYQKHYMQILNFQSLK